MRHLPNCPKCNSAYTYEDGLFYVCPECAHEWNETEQVEEAEEVAEEKVYRDAYGNVLEDGDTITVIKDLKIRGFSEVIKQGTTVKNITLIDEDHDIHCRVPGVGAMQLKSEFVKKI